MPQAPLNFVAKNIFNHLCAMLAGGANEVIVGTGAQAKVLTAASTTVLKTGPGRVARVNVTTAGTATGAVYDSASAGGIGAANLLATIPEAVGSYEVDMPSTNGIVVVLGAAMVATVSFD